MPLLYSLAHSAKGSTWEKHKYVKKVDGIYYYPTGYEGGRTMESFRKDLRNKRFTQRQLKSSTSSSKTETKKMATAKTKTGKLMNLGEPEEKTTTKGKITDKNLSVKQIETYAQAVIRGEYGNGAERRKALGDNYRKIQSKVNELLRKSGSKKLYKVTKTSTKKASASFKKSEKKLSKKEQKTSSTSSVKKGVDLSKVYEVYNKKKKK